MRVKHISIIALAALALATAFNFSCSNDNDNNPVAVSSSSEYSSSSGHGSSSSGQTDCEEALNNYNMAVTMNLNGEPVVVTKNGSVLTEGVNYNVSKTQNSIKVQGLKDYIGSVEKTNSNTSGIVVKDGSKVLAKNTDYRIEETSNSVKIVGMGNYTGSVEVVLPCEPTPPEPPTIIPPTITTASLPSATVGVAYSKTLEATGDNPIAWSIKSGNLPAGLSLSGNTISGTPTAAGTFNITVKATNAGGSDQKNFSIVVSAAAVEPTEGLMYWGHAANNDNEIILEWFDWHINEGLIESSSITGTVKEIQFHAGTGYRIILIPQSAGVPARIDNEVGINIKETTFVPVKNLVVKGNPYYLFITDASATTTGNGFKLTIKW